MDTRTLLAYGLIAAVAMSCAALAVFKWYNSHRRKERRRGRREDRAYHRKQSSKARAGSD